MSEYRITAAYDHIDEVKKLFQEYVTKEIVLKLGVDLEFQHFEEELENLQNKYPKETGGLYLIYWHEEIAGCIAFHKMDQESCEIKRLYVREPYRGHKLGEKAMSYVLKEARKKGYRFACFDTLPTMTNAIALYHKMGFVETGPYYHNPVPGALYFKKKL